MTMSASLLIVTAIFISINIMFFTAAISFKLRLKRHYSHVRRVSATTAAAANPPIYAAKKMDGEGTSTVSVLSTPLTGVKGIGPKTSEILAKLNLHRVADVLLHFPVDIIDRSNILTSILSIPSDANVVISISLVVDRVKEGFGNVPHQVWCRDNGANSIKIVYFFRGGPWGSPWKFLKTTYTAGNRIIVSGKVTRSKSSYQELELVNPDIAVIDTSAEINQVSTASSPTKFGMEPVYPLTAGLTATKLRPIITQAIEMASSELSMHDDKLSQFYQEIEKLQNNATLRDDNLKERNKKNIAQLQYSSKMWPSAIEAIKSIHYPKSNESFAVDSKARQRLAFDELVYLTYQKLAQERAQEAASESDMEQSDSKYELKLQTSGITDQFLRALPFNLTKSQQKCISDIFTDLESKEKMMRLVQGDVGSGKTVVAFMAMLRAVESGKQACLLAPTMILANQHYSNLVKLVKGIKNGDRDIGVRMITGSVVGKERLQLLKDVNDSTVDILIGTHALLSEKVLEAFNNNLGIVVIDEEQRFGVGQRELLTGRANALFTTATPIPRSLLLVTQQDKSISTLTEKPPSKRPIITVLRGASITNVIIDRLKANIMYGTKVFWVAPTLEPSKRMPGASATERFEQLNGLFPGQVGLLHGQMTDEQKKDVMDKFAMAESDIKILVATTVIEVGVDVPDASICIIDRAENFGLSQLHQIRGRIGRGAAPTGERLTECFCTLLYDDSASSTDVSGSENKEGWRKLQVLVDSTDGFEIADADLQLRGPGDIFGIKQSGAIVYKAADINVHFHLLLEAQLVANFLLASSNSDSARNALYFLESIFSKSTNNLLSTIKIKKKSVDESSTDESSTKIRAQAPKKGSSIGLGCVDLQKDDPIVLLFDVEATGLNTNNDRIIQMAAKVYGSDRQFSHFVLPPVSHKLSWEIEKLTGINQSFLEKSGISFRESWLLFESWLSGLQPSLASAESRRPIVIAAHNGKYDFKILGSELKRAFPTDYKVRYSAAFTGFLDTLPIFQNKEIWKRSGLAVPHNCKQVTLYQHLYKSDDDDKVVENAHNAIFDCIALEKILAYPGIDANWRDMATKIVYRHDID